jgi:hypothetical protein
VLIDLDALRVGLRMSRRLATMRPMGDYEFRQLSLPRGTSRSAAHRVLTDAAEHHGWELARLRLYPDGRRRVLLRRRILRVVRTM